MRKANIILLLFIITAVAGCFNSPYNYENKQFKFGVTLPQNYEQKKILTNNVDYGIELRSAQGTIIVQAMPAGTDHETMPFDKYVRIAAISEIQNYEKLISIKKIISDNGIQGYKTFWEVREIIPPDEYKPGMPSKRKIVGPIYYFPPEKEMKVGAQPVKTIMISCSAVSGELDAPIYADQKAIARSFRYLRGFW